MQYLSLYTFNLIIGAFGAWLLMAYGDRLGLSDIPNHRSSHSKATPKGGGIGILISVLTASIYLSIPVWFWMPSLMIAAISFFGGDKHKFAPNMRLAMHFICSFFFLFFCVTFDSNNLIYVLLSVFIVGTSNVYNFMDGIDGIAGVTGIVGFFLLAVYSCNNGINNPYGVLCVSIVFSCLGFLFFNLPKAKVFLGDVGSILLGFLFACLVIVFSKNVIDFLVMVGFLLTFYFDELYSMIIRIHNGDSLVKPHRKHIYQLMANELGISHYKIALLYGLVQLFVGLSAIYVSSKGVFSLVLLYLIYCLLFFCVLIKINQRVAAKREFE